jgi:predicted RNase H-like HicB family nuclease
MIIRAILEWDEEALSYSATCPELNFISSFGDSRDDAVTNLKDAILLMLEPIPEHLLNLQSASEIVELAV